MARLVRFVVGEAGFFKVDDKGVVGAISWPPSRTGVGVFFWPSFWGAREGRTSGQRD